MSGKTNGISPSSIHAAVPSMAPADVAFWQKHHKGKHVVALAEGETFQNALSRVGKCYLCGAFPVRINGEGCPY